MPNNEELIALAERCEAASGPDRELDRDIMLAAVPCDRAPFRYWAPMNENTGHGAVDVERVYYGPHCAQAVAVPGFTASLDAAMTLVPEEWWVQHLGHLIGGWCCRVETNGPPSHSIASGFGTKTGRPQTPALALTAACLRARAAA